MFKPSNLKSKREQLQEKKNWKEANKKETRVIDLDSDLDQPKEVSKVEKQVIDLERAAKPISDDVVESPAPKNQEFNRFNYFKMMKIVPSIVDDTPLLTKELGVVVDEGKIDDKERDAYKAYSFYVEGSKQQHNIRKIMLKDKSLLPLSRPTEFQEEPSKETKQPFEEKEEEVAEKKNRYFQVSHEMCFRCGKEGHYAKNCVEEDNRKCKTCFSREHQQRNCPQICFECGGVGHISSECPENRRDRCERCQKRGHSADYCGVILNDKVCMNRLEDYFLESDLRKVKCIVEDTQPHKRMNGHHFNCFMYKDWPMPYHELRKGNKNEVLRGVCLDTTGRDRVRLDSSYRTSNSDQDRAYNHYRDRFEREYGQDKRWGQNRSFSQGERWQRGQTSQNKNDRNRTGSKNAKNRSKFY